MHGCGKGWKTPPPWADRMPEFSQEMQGGNSRLQGANLTFLVLPGTWCQALVHHAGEAKGKMRERSVWCKAKH